MSARASAVPAARRRLEARIDDAGAEAMAADLGEAGWHVLPRLLTPEACREARAVYGEDSFFRSTIVMQRYGFGRGEYRYFRYPLPEPVASLRSRLYPPLAGIANRWREQLGIAARYPRTHEAYLAECRAAGQTRPTPLMLRYRAGDYNCLHQDLYGDAVFPLQLTILLSATGEEFDGGEFVITQQRPRMQSRAHVVSLRQGDGVIFAVNEAPRQGTRGVYRVKLRHGVSEVRRGERYAMGVIFHDAA